MRFSELERSTSVEGSRRGKERSVKSLCTEYREWRTWLNKMDFRSAQSLMLIVHINSRNYQKKTGRGAAEKSDPCALTQS